MTHPQAIQQEGTTMTHLTREQIEAMPRIAQIVDIVRGDIAKERAAVQKAINATDNRTLPSNISKITVHAAAHHGDKITVTYSLFWADYPGQPQTWYDTYTPEGDLRYYTSTSYEEATQ